MNRKARLNYIHALSNNVERKKMYKAKKQWVVAGISFLVATGLGAVGSHLTTHAASINNQQTTSVAPKLNSGSASNVNNQKSTINSVKQSSSSTIQSSANQLHSAILAKHVNSSVSSSNNNIAKPSFNASYKAYMASMSNIDAQVAKENNTNVKKDITPQNSKSSNHGLMLGATPAETGVYDGLNYKYNSNNKSVEFTGGTLNWKTDNSHPFIGQNAQSIPNYIQNAESVKFDDTVDFSKMNNTSWMFTGDKAIKHLDMGNNFDTSRMQSMNAMFSGDSNLETINFGNKFNTSRVSDMSYMFDNDHALQSIDLSHFDTSNVKNMSNMFESDKALTSLDVSHFNTNEVVSTDHMFSSDIHLQALNLSSWQNNGSITDMGFMFHNDQNLSTLTLSNDFNTSNVNSMEAMFANDFNIKSLDVSGFNTEKVQTSEWMFHRMKSLQSIKFGNHFDTSKDTNMMQMFASDYSLPQLELPSSFNTAAATNMQQMFKSDQSLTNLSWQKGFTTASNSSMYQMFLSDMNLTSLDLSNLNTSNVGNMNGAFANDSKLQSINFGKHFNTAKVSDMSYMFNGDSNLQSLDLSDFTTGNVNNMAWMFVGDKSLKDLDLHNFTTPNLTNMNAMFSGDSKLETLDISNFDTSHVTNMTYLLDNDNNLTTLKLGSKTGLQGYTTIDFPGIQMINPQTQKQISFPPSNKLLYQPGTWTRNAELINFFKNGKQIGSKLYQQSKGSKIVLNSGVLASILPKLATNHNYALADSNQGSINVDGSTVNVDVNDVAPNQDTDTIIFYDRNGQNEVSQYSDTGDDGENININVPKDFELVNNTPQKFSNSAHELEVQVRPSDANDSEIVDAIVTGKSNIPKGHKVITPTDPTHQNNKPSDVPAGKPSDTPYDPADTNDTEYITINDYNGNGTKPSDLVKSYTKRMTINGNTGYSDSIDPSTYATTGYSDTPSDHKQTVTINSDELLSPQHIIFDYQHQPAYTNVIFHYTDDNGQKHTINGGRHDSTVGSDFLPQAPVGYHYVNHNQQGMIMKKGNNGTDDLAVQGNNITGTATVNLVYKDSTGKTLSKNSTTINLSGHHVGDAPLVIHANKHGKPGYGINNNTWAIEFNPDDANTNYTPSTEFDYVGTEAGQVEVQFFDRDYKMDKPVGNPQYLRNLGPADTTIHIKLGAVGANDGNGVQDILNIPKGYKLVQPVNSLSITLPDKGTTKKLMFGLFATSSKSSTNSANSNNSSTINGSTAPSSSSASSASSASISMNSSELSSLANEIGGDINVTVRPNVTNTTVDNTELASLTNEVATENQSINSLANKPENTSTINYANFDNLINSGINQLTTAINTGFKADIHSAAKSTSHKPANVVRVRKHIKWIMVTKPLKLYKRAIMVGSNHGVDKVIRPNHKITLNVKSVYKVHGHFIFKVTYNHHNYFISDNHTFIRNAYLSKDNKLAGKKVQVIHNVYEYKHQTYGVIRTLHKGSILRIKRIVQLGNYNMTRIQLTNGNWVSANKNYVRVL